MQKKKMIFGTEGDFSQQHIKEEKKNMDRAQARKKAEALVAKMTIEERAGQLKYDAPAIERLGIPTYNWWNEALHGVARAGTATVFPQAIGCAAMFDEEEMQKIADVIAEEGRAKYNAFSKEEDRDIYKGLTFWSPNINIFRDPRWGRGHETYGEDPFLTARLGVSFIKGLQGDGETMKVAACAKHFAVHSGPEGLRHSFNAEVTKKDLYETYLSAFHACIKEAKPEAVMGAYNRVNGEPCCGSKTLLTDILRNEWHFKGHVVSDCFALRDFYQHHMVTKDAVESAALAMNNGCDLNCGHMYLHLSEAVSRGMVSESRLRAAVTNLYTTRLKLGMEQDKELPDNPYDKIPYSVVDSVEMREFNESVSEKIFVLLKNNGILPLNREKLRTIAVIGPNADSRRALVGNYEGTASRYITISEGIQDYVGDSVRVLVSEGCDLYKENWKKNRIAEVREMAEMSDVVILCLGLDAGIEGEQGDAGNDFASGDKPDLNLPGEQNQILEAALDSGKPVVVLLLSGSALAVNTAQERAAAVMQCWYPGAQGGRAAARILFGEVSPQGHLPVTFYKSTEELPEFTDYSMKNRTYRYMKQEALYPFGYGLTYTSFSYDNMECGAGRQTFQKMKAGEKIQLPVSVRVCNTGNFDCAETVQVYVKALCDGSPNPQLKGFGKVFLKAGEEKQVTVWLSEEAFELYDENGQIYFTDEGYTVYIGGSQPDTRSRTLTGTIPLRQNLWSEVVNNT